MPLLCLTLDHWFPSYRTNWIWVVYTAQWSQSWWEEFAHRLKGLLQASLLERWQLCVWVWHTGEFLEQLFHPMSALLLCLWLCRVAWSISWYVTWSHTLKTHLYTKTCFMKEELSSLHTPFRERLHLHPKWKLIAFLYTLSTVGFSLKCLCSSQMVHL